MYSGCILDDDYNVSVRLQIHHMTFSDTFEDSTFLTCVVLSDGRDGREHVVRVSVLVVCGAVL